MQRGIGGRGRRLKLEPGGFRDHAEQGFVWEVRELDPETAANWAGSIGDTAIWRDTVRSVLREWRTSDREAARAFVKRIDSAELRDEMWQLADE